MRLHANEYADTLTGEINCTQLAEACAAKFDVNHIGGPLDDETHWIWEMALKAADTTLKHKCK